MREFREKDHTYWVDGKQYVGVNELLESEGLTQDLARFIPAEKLAYCCAKGKAGHKIAQLICKGTLDEKTIDSRLSHQTAEIKRFMADFEVIPAYTEKVLWDDNKRFAGTSDLPACKTNKGLAIVDFGFGQTKHHLHLHAYKLLVKAALDVDIETLIDVQFPEEGRYKVKVYKPEKKIEILIMSALMLYNFKARRM